MNNVNTLEQEATDLRDQGKGLEAIEKYKQAKKLYQDAGDLVNAAGMQLMIGVCLNIENKVDEALAAYDDALADYKKSGDKLGPGRVARDQAIVCINHDRFDEGEKYLQQSKVVFEALPGDTQNKQTVDEAVTRDSELGITLAKLGLLYVHLKRFDDAEKFLMDGLQLIRQSGHPSYEVTALMHLANLYFETKHYGRMLANVEAALGLIYEHTMTERHARRLSEIWGLMAHGYLQLGNRATAKHFAKKSLNYIGTLSHDAQHSLRKSLKADELEKLL